MNSSVLAVFFLLRFVHPLLILGALALLMTPFVLAIVVPVVVTRNVRDRRRVAAPTSTLPPPPAPPAGPAGTEPPGSGLRG